MNKSVLGHFSSQVSPLVRRLVFWGWNKRFEQFWWNSGAELIKSFRYQQSWFCPCSPPRTPTSSSRNENPENVRMQVTEYQNWRATRISSRSPPLKWLGNQGLQSRLHQVDTTFYLILHIETLTSMASISKEKCQPFGFILHLTLVTS